MNPIPCDRCGGETFLIANLPPLEAQAAQQVFCCKSCKHLTWRDWKQGHGN
jgi:hypothetical protein